MTLIITATIYACLVTIALMICSANDTGDNDYDGA